MKIRHTLMIIVGVFLVSFFPPLISHFQSSKIVYASEPQAQMLPVGAKIKVGSSVVELELASTPKEQALGLMYRTYLPKNRGMLFVISEPRNVAFWMKNMKISIDMIFLYNGEILEIAENVPPCANIPCPTYGPQYVLVDQVIELSAGRAAELGLKVGDRLNVEFLNTPTN